MTLIVSKLELCLFLDLLQPAIIRIGVRVKPHRRLSMILLTHGSLRVCHLLDNPFLAISCTWAAIDFAHLKDGLESLLDILICGRSWSLGL